MDTNRDGAAADADADADEEDKLTGHVVVADLRNDATVAPAMRFILMLPVIAVIGEWPMR